MSGFVDPEREQRIAEELEAMKGLDYRNGSRFAKFYPSKSKKNRAQRRAADRQKPRKGGRK